MQVAAVHHELMDSQLVSTLRTGRKLAYAFTVDAPAELQRLLDLGIDGIVTNNAALLSQAVNQRMQKCSTVQQLKR
jgi:glycerophosphoryl diester phosphodiesterase